MECITVSDSSVYPEIRVQGENRLLAEQLCSVFGGNNGEFGSTAQYIRQCIAFGETQPFYAEAFFELAKTEMKHMKMMGELIKKLGGEPVYGWYSGREPIYWNGGSINYTDDLAAALLHDLDGEQRAYGAYVSFARRSGDRYVFAVLTRIALDEMIHINLIKSLIARLRKV